MDLTDDPPLAELPDLREVPAASIFPLLAPFLLVFIPVGASSVKSIARDVGPWPCQLSRAAGMHRVAVVGPVSTYKLSAAAWPPAEKT